MKEGVKEGEGGPERGRDGGIEVGVCLLCSKIYLLCYATVLKEVHNVVITY